MKSLSHVRLFATPWTVAYQSPLSMGFSRQEYWSGLPFPSLGDLPDPGIVPGSPALKADALTSEQHNCVPNSISIILQYKYVPCNIWIMIILKQTLLFIWHSDLTRHPIFYLANLCGALVRSTCRPCEACICGLTASHARLPGYRSG